MEGLLTALFKRNLGFDQISKTAVDMVAEQNEPKTRVFGLSLLAREIDYGHSYQEAFDVAQSIIAKNRETPAFSVAMEKLDSPNVNDKVVAFSIFSLFVKRERKYDEASQLVEFYRSSINLSTARGLQRNPSATWALAI